MSRLVDSLQNAGLLGSPVTIARADCHYRLFSLSGIPAAERRSALEVMVKEWSPYPDTVASVVWQGTDAQVWIWDRSAETAAKPDKSLLARLGHRPEPVVESRHYAVPSGEQVRLVKCERGVEGQVWQRGTLLSSRWWPDTPSEEQWLRFQRSASVRDYAKQAAVAEMDRLPRPWGRAKRLGRESHFGSERRLWALAGFVLLFLCAWLLADTVRLHNAVAQTQAENQRRTKEAHPMLKARERVVAVAGDIDRIAALWPDKRLLQLWQQTIDILPDGDSTTLEELSFTEADFSLVVSGRRFDPEPLVRAYQALDWVGDVSIRGGKLPGQTRIKISYRESQND